MQSPSVFLLTALGALVISQGAASTTPTRADRAEPQTAAAALTPVYAPHTVPWLSAKASACST